MRDLDTQTLHAMANPHGTPMLPIDTGVPVDLPDPVGDEHIIGFSVPTAAEIANLVYPLEVTR